MNESTFQSFYDSTKHALWRYIASLTKDDALADDMFQETYIKFLQTDVEFVTDEQKKSYLYRIATNSVRDEWRKMKHRQRWSDSDAEPSLDTTRSMDLRHDMHEAMNQLPPQQRSLLWLAYAEQFEHREIAEILKLREKSVKVLLFRAKRKLAFIFKRMGMTSEATL